MYMYIHAHLHTPALRYEDADVLRGLSVGRWVARFFIQANFFSGPVISSVKGDLGEEPPLAKLEGTCSG